MSTLPSKQRGGFFGLSAKRWESTNIAPAQEINQSDAFMYGASPTTISTIMGSGKKAARSRQLIYDKWSLMESDGIVSTAVSLLVTAALGGHETNGQVVFIEKKPDTLKNIKLAKLVDEINQDLSPLLNRIAFTSAYVGAVFGDAYARIYTSNKGVAELYIDEMVRPPLIVPFEKGSKTIGYFYYDPHHNSSGKLMTGEQIARLKMPRTQWTPQTEVVQKSFRYNIYQDELDSLEPYVAMAGGSFLYNAEEAYDNLATSLLGLVGQRWMDSIDEQLVAVNMESMTAEQQKFFINSVTTMLKKSKQIAEDSVKNGKPVLERIRHLIPVFNEKQLTQINPTQSGRSSVVSIEDVMIHAKLLAGALGVDLSMIGFADLLAGGLGEGGFFRTSAQVAERARVIRSALADFFNHIIDIHTLKRYGSVFSEQERPWDINFYGSISALEAERQRTKADAMNGGMLLVQSMQMFKDIGANKDMMLSFLTKNMMLDEDQATLFAAIVEQQAANAGGESE